MEFSAQNVSSNKALNSQDIKCCNFLTGLKPHIGEIRGAYLCLGDSLVAGTSGLRPGTAVWTALCKAAGTEHPPSLCVFISDRQIGATEKFRSKHECSFSYGPAPGSRDGTKRKKTSVTCSACTVLPFTSGGQSRYSVYGAQACGLTARQQMSSGNINCNTVQHRSVQTFLNNQIRELWP